MDSALDEVNTFLSLLDLPSDRVSLSLESLDEILLTLEPSA
jgi:hypothetical protein